MDNRIEAVVSADEKQQILGLIQDIKTRLPFLIDLTLEEKRALPKMGDKSRSFVSQALTLAEQDESFLPRSFDVSQMRKDVDLTESLFPVMVALSKLSELVEDTYILAGSEAYTSALIVYQSAKSSGKGEGMDNLLDSLGRRFARKTKEKPTE